VHPSTTTPPRSQAGAPRRGPAANQKAGCHPNFSPRDAPPRLRCHGFGPSSLWDGRDVCEAVRAHSRLQVTLSIVRTRATARLHTCTGPPGVIASVGRCSAHVPRPPFDGRGRFQRAARCQDQERVATVTEEDRQQKAPPPPPPPPPPPDGRPEPSTPPSPPRPDDRPERRK